MKNALVLIDHGSHRPESGNVLLRAVEKIRSTGAWFFVAGAHMDIEQPSLRMAIETCLAQQPDRIVIVPFMLAPGRHSAEDIPRLAREAAPDLLEGRIIVAAPIGRHDGVVQAVIDSANEAIGIRPSHKGLLLSAEESTLMLIDLQQNLMPHIANREPILHACRYLARAARELAIPILISEQYPKGLGPTDPALMSELPETVKPIDKICFGSLGAPAISSALPPGRSQLLICGVEAHICVLQTAMQALERGLDVYLAIDAAGSRKASDFETALLRMESSGVHLLTAEMAVYEWLREAGTPAFKALLPMLKQGLT